MKKGSNIYINFISFIVGSLLTYGTLQYSFFNINSEINVVETLLSIITALIGLYIAISIQKKTNRNQSLHSIIQRKMDDVWSDFSLFDNQLNSQNTVQLKIVTKAIKSLYKDLNLIKMIFNTFSLDCHCIEALEEKMDKLDSLITSELPVTQNVINLSKHKKLIRRESDLIHQDIVKALKEINGIL